MIVRIARYIHIYFIYVYINYIYIICNTNLLYTLSIVKYMQLCVYVSIFKIHTHIYIPWRMHCTFTFKYQVFAIIIRSLSLSMSLWYKWGEREETYCTVIEYTDSEVRVPWAIYLTFKRLFCLTCKTEVILLSRSWQRLSDWIPINYPT